MSSEPVRVEALLSRVVDGIASEEEFRELEALLRTSPELQRRYVHAMDLHAELQERWAASFEAEHPERKTVVGPWRWFRRGARTALAAGILLGAFGASFVFGGVSLFKTRGVAVLREGFEQGPPPGVTGVPREAGTWGGDFSEVVAAQGEVQPVRGAKMLRFLRADYQGKPNPEGSRTSGVWRLIDLRSFTREIREGTAEIQISALINSARTERQYAAFLSVYSWSAEGWKAVDVKNAREIDSSALALSRGSWVELDQDPATWQPMEAALRLPDQTDFVLFHAAVKEVSAQGVPAQFGGQYLDHVRMTLWTRIPMQ
jgi:hypothetical protein